MKGVFRVRKNFMRLLAFIMACVLLLFNSAQVVQASGWFEPDESALEKLYGEEDKTGTISPSGIKEEDPSVVEEFISKMIRNLAVSLHIHLSKKNIDISIEGIVLGRLAPGLGLMQNKVQADFTHFGLEDNNPWGIIGATLYYLLRNALLAVLPIILLVMLMRELLHNTGVGRARLKEMVLHTVYVFALLFLLPYVLDLFFYLRDAILYGVHNGFMQLINILPDSGGDVSRYQSQSMVMNLADSAANSGRLLDALLLLAMVLAGVFFLVDYVRIAFILCGAFGLFPVAAVMSYWNKKKLSEWANVFFPNLCVPLIDMVGILIPSILSKVFYRVYGNTNDSILILSVITLIVMWNVVAVRNRLVKLLGFDGIGGGGNIGQMLNTLAHVMPGRAHGGGHGGNGDDGGKETRGENEQRSERAAAMGREMDSAMDEMIDKGDESLFIDRKRAEGSATDAMLTSEGAIDYSGHFDEDFASTVLGGSDRDMARYENLAKRDALREEIGKNEEIINSTGYRGDTYIESRESLAGRSEELSGNIDSLKAERASLISGGHEESERFRTVESQIRDAQSEKAKVDSGLAKLDAAHDADIQNRSYRVQLDRLDRNESRFAEINGYNGGSTQSYATAKAYKHGQNVAAIKKQQMDYRNFDSAQYKGLLTPEEEVEFRRQRDANRYRDAAAEAGINLARGAGRAVVGGAVGTVGAFAAGFGGMTVSAGAGLLGARAGVGVVNAAEYAPEAIEAGARLARESVQAAYMRDKMVFSSGGTSSGGSVRRPTAEGRFKEMASTSRRGEREMLRERAEADKKAEAHFKGKM